MTVCIKRVYEPAKDSDGLRILVDRVWPRGISREEARISFWEKDVAPTTVLRKWFGHKPERWAEFRRRYLAELKQNPALAELRKFVRSRRVTLLYGARDQEHNQAVVLASLLRRSAAGPRKAVKARRPEKKKAT